MFASFSKNNSIIKDGQILSSKIDMDGEKITSLADPTAGSDAVNKTYCDQNLSGNPIVTITLTGTSWTQVLLDQYGTFDIIVSNIVVGGPCGKFTVMKSESSRNASIQRWGSSAGSNTFERLEMQWPQNSGLELRKNGVNYDGSYRLRYFKV